MMRLAVIIASTRRGRFGPTVAEWFTTRARRNRDFEIDLVDLAETRLPSTLGDHDEAVPWRVAQVGTRLAAADAFVIITPEYNHSFPAPLKTAIDWFCEEWRAKPVAFVSYGRESGGLHAVAQLREIFTGLHAVTIPLAISLPCYWNLFTADGRWPKPTAPCNTAVTALLTQIAWWARALREARAARPYTP